MIITRASGVSDKLLSIDTHTHGARINHLQFSRCGLANIDNPSATKRATIVYSNDDGSTVPNVCD